MTGEVADSLNNLPIGKVKAADLIQSDIKSDPATKLPVKAFNSVGRIDQPSYLLRILEIGAEIWPVFSPGSRNLRIFLVPMLSEGVQSS